MGVSDMIRQHLQAVGMKGASTHGAAEVLAVFSKEQDRDDHASWGDTVSTVQSNQISYSQHPALAALPYPGCVATCA